MTTSTINVPGLVAGTWTIDPTHSSVGFAVRHLMVSRVRGTFDKFEGAITIGEDPADSSVEATIDLNSIETRDPQRDAHLRSADFFEVEKYPTMTYRSTSVSPDGGDFIVEGELTLKGVTKPVSLRLEFNGVNGDPYGGTRAGFYAETEINRNDFGVDISMPLDGGGVVVGEKVKISIDIEAILQKDEA
jgi:polyisoprenoid-binding protein YceI